LNRDLNHFTLNRSGALGSGRHHFDVLQEMESLRRQFRPRLSLVIATAFILPMIVVFIGAALPFESLAFGNMVVSIAAVTLLGALCLLFTRLDLNAEGDHFSLVVHLFKTPIIQRRIRGSAWHAIARPGRSFDASPNEATFYRVEVADLEGNRRLVMGELLSFLYGVECL
jgi:hypothetical protein